MFILSKCINNNDDNSLVSINSICKNQSQVENNCKYTNKCINRSNTPIIGFQNTPQPSRKYNLVNITKNPSVALSSGEHIRRNQKCN